MNFQPTFRLSSIMAKTPKRGKGDPGSRQGGPKAGRFPVTAAVFASLLGSSQKEPWRARCWPQESTKAPDSKVDKLTKQVINLDSVMVAIEKQGINSDPHAGDE